MAKLLFSLTYPLKQFRSPLSGCDDASFIVGEFVGWLNAKQVVGKVLRMLLFEPAGLDH